MHSRTIISFLSDMMSHANGRRVFSILDLMKVFPDTDRKTLREFLSRHCSGPSPLLVRACRGVYVNASAPKGDVLQEIAKVCRRGYSPYLSNESVLSSYGVISQIPFDRITVMTTGREGEVKTPYGVIEFTHTSSPPSALNSEVYPSPLGANLLPVASLERAVRDYKVSKRPVEAIDQEALQDILEEMSPGVSERKDQEACHEPAS